MSTGTITQTLRETLDAIDPGRPVTTPEVAETLDLGRRSTYERLERLVDADCVETKKVGANARVWWQPPPADGSDEAVEDDVLLSSVLDELAVGVVVLDEYDDVVWTNEAIERYFGIDRKEVTGRDMRKLVESEIAPVAADPDAFEEEYLSLCDDGSDPGQFEFRVEAGDGTRQRYLEYRSSHLGEGEYAGGRVELYYDLTELTRTQEELARQRDDLERELEEVYERIDDGVLGLDDEFRITHLNDSGAETLGVDRSEAVGQPFVDVFPDVIDTPFEAAAMEAMSDGESTTFEAYYEPLDSWFEATVYPSETGVSAYFRNVTERVERERELERYETVVEAMNDGVYTVDPEGRLTLVNDRYAEMMGQSPSELVGTGVQSLVDDSVVEKARRLERRLVEGDLEEATLQADFETEDGELLVAEATFAISDPPDGERERVAVVRDVTERAERERDLEQYERIVDTIDDGIYAVDDDCRFVTVNDAFCELTGYDREELIGRRSSVVHDGGLTPDDCCISAGRTDRDHDGESVELDVEVRDGETVHCETRLVPMPVDDGGVCGVIRDVSGRVERERELRHRVRQQEVVTELGQRALETEALDDLLADAVDTVAETLDADFCKLLELESGGDRLYLRHGVGWNEGIVGNETVSAVESDSQAAYTLASSEPIVVEDLATEDRFSGPALLTDHGVRSGISTIVGPPDDPWGILSVHDAEPNESSPNDVTFLQSVANLLAAAIDRRGSEQEVTRQREHLAALDDLNGVVRDVTETVLEQSTREAIETAVCQRIADADSYEFAWIGEVDAETQTVSVRSEAGVEDYLDDVTISVDPEDPKSIGPTGQAMIHGEVRTAKDAWFDATHEPWREHVRNHGFRSSIAIPIQHEGTLYGVLNVYAKRVGAFEDEELAVIEQTGEVVGHAIASVERKRALISDQVTELEFAIEEFFESQDVGVANDGRITFERTVTTGEGRFLQYGTVTECGVEYLERLADELDNFQELTIFDDESPLRFELRLTDPPLVSTVVANNGYLKKAVIEDGDLSVCVHLPPSVDARRIVDAVEESYPSAELLARRQVTSEQGSVERLERHLTEVLTDRQQAAIEAALFSGYFEWPRESSGEDVADSLGVSPPTFHQHLRKAQRSLFEAAIGNAGS